MAGETNVDPFLIIDDAQNTQLIHVVSRSFDGGVRVLPYSLAELTASTVTVNDFGYLTASVGNVSSSISSSNILLGEIKDQITASYNELTASNEYLSSISGTLSSSNILIEEISSSQINIYNQLTASYDIQTSSYNELTASNEYLSNISGTLSSSYLLLSDISSSDALIYSTVTASYDKLSGSYDELTASNLTLTNIHTAINTLSESVDRTYSYLTSALQQVTNNLTQSANYLKEINAYCRATAAYSSIFSGSNLQGLDLATTGSMMPDVTYNEQYLRACVDVLIQNSTNKNCYIKVSHMPGAAVSPTNYTIKLPPGVIYNSDSQLASMRHVIYVTGSEDMYGEVSAMMTYNSALRSSASLPDLIYPNTIKSLAVNAYNFYNDPIVLNEWTFEPQGTDLVYDKMVIIGQARVSEAGEELLLTLESGLTVCASHTITSTEPTTFIIETSSCPPGRYEFKAEGDSLYQLGNGRVLFADLLITTSSV